MNKLKIHTFETKLLNNFKVLKKFTIILSRVIDSMFVKKCGSSADSPSYLNDDDMIICNSCGGWIEGQY